MTILKSNSKFIMFFLFVVITASWSFNIKESPPKKLYYYGFSDKIEIQQVPNKILIKKKRTISKSNVESTIKSLFVNTDFHVNN